MRANSVLCAVTAILIAGTAGEFPTSALAADSGGTVSLQTVPALAGVRVAVGPSVVTTDSSGSERTRRMSAGIAVRLRHSKDLQ